MSNRNYLPSPTAAPRTYAETQGNAPFDWCAFLRRATVGGITVEEHEAAAERAAQWTTCACGNQCDAIPRTSSVDPGQHGAPVDDELQTLGHLFYVHIYYRNWQTAIETLTKIEARSAELIASMPGTRGERALLGNTIVALK